MQITFVCPTANLSGGIRVIAIYARQLMRRGHIVRIVSLPSPPITLGQKFKSWMKRFSHHEESHFDGSGVDHYILDRWRPITDHDLPKGDVVIATWWETAEWVNMLSSEKGAKVYFIQGHEVFPHLPVARCRATYAMPLHKIVCSQWLKEI